MSVTVIECTNCGGGTDWLSLLVSFLAVVVAAIALGITAREHREFMRQLQASAHLAIEFSVTNYDIDPASGVLLHEASQINPIIRVTVRNTGNRTATDVVVNVEAPVFAENFRWCDPKGGPPQWERVPAAMTQDEPLTDESGTELPTQVLAYVESKLQTPWLSPAVASRSSHTSDRRNRDAKASVRRRTGGPCPPR